MMTSRDKIADVIKIMTSLSKKMSETKTGVIGVHLYQRTTLYLLPG